MSHLLPGFGEIPHKPSLPIQGLPHRTKHQGGPVRGDPVGSLWISSLHAHEIPLQPHSITCQPALNRHKDTYTVHIIMEWFVQERYLCLGMLGSGVIFKRVPVKAHKSSHRSVLLVSWGMFYNWRPGGWRFQEVLQGLWCFISISCKWSKTGWCLNTEYKYLNGENTSQEKSPKRRVMVKFSRLSNRPIGLFQGNTAADSILFGLVSPKGLTFSALTWRMFDSTDTFD